MRQDSGLPRQRRNVIALDSANRLLIVVDKHPGYRSSIAGRLWAKTQSLPLIEVQHHHAHIAACLAENAWPLQGGKVLGIVLDGSGYGDDGTLWGGEFLQADYHGYTRLGHFRPTVLPGGTQAILQPWRNTWAQLAAVGWEGLAAEFAQLELIRYLQCQPLATLEAMRLRGINSPLSSSCGRLLDAVAAALGLSRDRISYEGQAAIELEAATAGASLAPAYPLEVPRNAAGLWEIDPAPLWRPLLRDLQTGKPRAVIAARFHHGLVATWAATAARICAEHPEITAIVLSGGVFQNALILRDLPAQLQALRRPILTHSTVPTNDGGLALGQAVVALAQR